MRQVHAALLAALTSIVVATGTASAAGGLMTCGKCIGTTPTGSTGVGTANAKVRSVVTEADVAEYCERVIYDPAGMADCLTNTRRNELGTELSASANCKAGTMSGIDGKPYRYVGRWGSDEVTGVAIGEPQFARADGSVVSTDHAGGGRELATNWYRLCGEVAPSASGSPIRAAGSNDRVLGEPYDHNGSTTTIDTHAGVILYAEPKPGIRKHVRPQTVLFRGSMSDPREVRGTAFTFKAGCEPAPYSVRGRFSNGYQSTLTLVGKAPVRSKSGCAITGYSASSANARLVFEYEFPPEL